MKLNRRPPASLTENYVPRAVQESGRSGNAPFGLPEKRPCAHLATLQRSATLRPELVPSLQARGPWQLRAPSLPRGFGFGAFFSCMQTGHEAEESPGHFELGRGWVEQFD